MSETQAWILIAELGVFNALLAFVVVFTFVQSLRRASAGPEPLTPPGSAGA